MSQSNYDIAVLGMGPVGCLAAITLARSGLKVAAIERDMDVYKLPRAVNLDAEIVRALQPYGLAEEVNSLLQTVRPGERVGFANSKREFMFGRPSAEFGANGWQPMNMFDQPELEGYLRQTALDHDNVDAFIGYTAVDFAEIADTVVVDIEAGDTTRQVSASYLLACDGASSFVRSKLNIGWHDLGYNHDWLVVDVITKPGHTLDTTTLQVCDPDRITTYVCTKEPYRRWEFKLNEGETWDEMLQPERIQSLIDPWTPPGTYDIRRAAMYQFHAATADTWRVGRIFIGGDAAHQTPPFLGQGMNAGMRDVINLAWKLPMVINGICSPELLDSYQAEREAHAHDLVEWAVSIGRLMEHLAAVEAAENSGAPPPEEPPGLRQAGYGQGRDQPPLRAGVIMQQQVKEGGAAGFLFSQPFIQADDDDTLSKLGLSRDQKVRLDEVLGPGFCIVGKTAADLEVSEASLQLLDKIGASRVSLAGLDAARGHFDRAFEFTDVVIVRPDRYVFGHADAEHSLDDLIADLAQKLYINSQ
jgi:3-(3-hydroxy-phenyl)propionate hydroxylase